MLKTKTWRKNNIMLFLQTQNSTGNSLQSVKVLSKVKMSYQPNGCWLRKPSLCTVLPWNLPMQHLANHFNPSMLFPHPLSSTGNWMYSLLLTHQRIYHHFLHTKADSAEQLWPPCTSKHERKSRDHNSAFIMPNDVTKQGHDETQVSTRILAFPSSLQHRDTNGRLTR